jgi:hypothetical protein
MSVKEDEFLEPTRLWNSATKAMHVILAEYNWEYLTSKMNCKLVVSFGVDYIDFSFLFFFCFFFLFFFLFLLYKIVQCGIAGP